MSVLNALNILNNKYKLNVEIKNHVKDGLTTKLGSELMNVLKVNEMLKIEK